MCMTVSGLKGESVPWAFVRGDWSLGLGVEGLYFVLPSPPDRLVTAGRLQLTGAGLNSVLSVFEAIVCALLVWSKMKWSLGDISAG